MDTLLNTIKSVPDIFWPGDIGVVVQNDIIARLQEKLITPPTRMFHMFLITEYVPDENDWIIYESTPLAGVSIGRLSWYNGQHIMIFRPVKYPSSTSQQFDMQWGKHAIWNSTKDGRKYYNYIVCVKVIWRLFNYCGRHIKPAPYTIFPNDSSHTVICTMFANDAWKEICAIFDPKYLPIPANFVQQVDEEKLALIGDWKGDKTYGRTKYRIGVRPKS